MTVFEWAAAMFGILCLVLSSMLVASVLLGFLKGIIDGISMGIAAYQLSKVKLKKHLSFVWNSKFYDIEVEEFDELPDGVISFCDEDHVCVKLKVPEWRYYMTFDEEMREDDRDA